MLIQLVTRWFKNSNVCVRCSVTKPPNWGHCTTSESDCWVWRRSCFFWVHLNLIRFCARRLSAEHVYSNDRVCGGRYRSKMAVVSHKYSCHVWIVIRDVSFEFSAADISLMFTDYLKALEMETDDWISPSVITVKLTELGTGCWLTCAVTVLLDFEKYPRYELDYFTYPFSAFFHMQWCAFAYGQMQAANPWNNR